MGLLSGLKDSLKQDSAEFITSPLKGYLKKDINSLYSFLDKEASIKLVFNNKFIKDYLSTLPTYLTYDVLDTYAITLKRYRFDYLLYALNNQLSFRIVCYVDTFSLDTSFKKHFDPLPDNVNMISDITSDANEVLDIIIRDLLNKKNHLDLHDRLTANNFINNNFSNEQKQQDVFSIIQSEIGTTGDMVLIKSKEAIKNNGYLYDDNDSKTSYQLKQVDWKGLYTSNSRICVPGKEFNPDGTPLATLLEKVTFKNIHASDLSMDVDIGENVVKEFLKRKTKRQNIDEFKTKNMPENIMNLMEKYGDVLANIGMSDICKYQQFKGYSKLIK